MFLSPILYDVSCRLSSLLIVLLSPVDGKLADSLGSRLITSSGMVIIGAPLLLLFLIVHETWADIMILPGMIGVGFGKNVRFEHSIGVPWHDEVHRADDEYCCCNDGSLTLRAHITHNRNVSRFYK